MQPSKHAHRNPTCAKCNNDLVAREWRVRNTNNCGESWHPRCFATTWPTIPIQLPPDVPPTVEKLIKDIHQQTEGQSETNNQPTPRQANTHPNTPDQPNHHDRLPPLHGLTEIDWDTILEFTPTAKNVPPQCQTLYIQLIHHTCAHILLHTHSNNEIEAANGWKLLMAIPRFVLANRHKHRAGRKGQGNATLTKTIRYRISLIYNAQWDKLLTPCVLGGVSKCA